MNYYHTVSQSLVDKPFGTIRYTIFCLPFDPLVKTPVLKWPCGMVLFLVSLLCFDKRWYCRDFGFKEPRHFSRSTVRHEPSKWPSEGTPQLFLLYMEQPKGYCKCVCIYNVIISPCSMYNQCTYFHKHWKRVCRRTHIIYVWTFFNKYCSPRNNICLTFRKTYGTLLLIETLSNPNSSNYNV